MISKLGSLPFLRRQQVESEAGEAGKKVSVGKTLPRPPAGTAPATKSVVGSDHFERATGGLFATAFGRHAQGAPADERTLPGRVDRGFADGGIEPYLDAALLTGGARSSELRALGEQLKQLAAEKKALQEAILEVRGQIYELETELAKQGKSSGFDLEEFLAGRASGPPPDPRMLELMETMKQLQERIAAVNEQIADVVQEIKKAAQAPEQEALRVEEPADLLVAKAPAGEQQVTSARHLRHAVSFGDKDP